MSNAAAAIDNLPIIRAINDIIMNPDEVILAGFNMARGVFNVGASALEGVANFTDAAVEATSSYTLGGGTQAYQQAVEVAGQEAALQNIGLQVAEHTADMDPIGNQVQTAEGFMRGGLQLT